MLLYAERIAGVENRTEGPAVQVAVIELGHISQAEQVRVQIEYAVGLHCVKGRDPRGAGAATAWASWYAPHAGAAGGRQARPDASRARAMTVARCASGAAVCTTRSTQASEAAMPAVQAPSPVTPRARSCTSDQTAPPSL